MILWTHLSSRANRYDAICRYKWFWDSWFAMVDVTEKANIPDARCRDVKLCCVRLRRINWCGIHRHSVLTSRMKGTFSYLSQWWLIVGGASGSGWTEWLHGIRKEGKIVSTRVVQGYRSDLIEEKFTDICVLSADRFNSSLSSTEEHIHWIDQSMSSYSNRSSSWCGTWCRWKKRNNWQDGSLNMEYWFGLTVINFTFTSLVLCWIVVIFIIPV